MNTSHAVETANHWLEDPRTKLIAKVVGALFVVAVAVFGLTLPGYVNGKVDSIKREISSQIEDSLRNQVEPIKRTIDQMVGKDHENDLAAGLVRDRVNMLEQDQRERKAAREVWQASVLKNQAETKAVLDQVRATQLENAQKVGELIGALRASGRMPPTP